MLDVLLQQAILKIDVLDRAAGDVMVRENADQLAVIHDGHMRNVQFRHQAAQVIDAVLRVSHWRVDFHDVAASGLHQVASLGVQSLEHFLKRNQAQHFIGVGDDHGTDGVVCHDCHRVGHQDIRPDGKQCLPPSLVGFVMQDFGDGGRAHGEDGKSKSTG